MGTQDASRAAVAIFHGRVQGVFFRANTKKFARRNGLTGCVMNCTAGSDKAVFEGAGEEIERTIHQCVHEQPYAKVTAHDVKWGEASGKFKDFRIEYRGGC